MDQVDLVSFRDRIDKLSKEHHVEVAKLLIADKVQYNENQNGIFVNLCNLPYETYLKVLSYTEFIRTKETSLTEIEEEKGMLLAAHFK